MACEITIFQHLLRDESKRIDSEIERNSEDRGWRPRERRDERIRKQTRDERDERGDETTLEIAGEQVAEQAASGPRPNERTSRGNSLACL